MHMEADRQTCSEHMQVFFQVWDPQKLSTTISCVTAKSQLNAPQITFLSAGGILPGHELCCRFSPLGRWKSPRCSKGSSDTSSSRCARVGNLKVSLHEPMFYLLWQKEQHFLQGGGVLCGPVLINTAGCILPTRANDGQVLVDMCILCMRCNPGT